MTDIAMRSSQSVSLAKHMHIYIHIMYGIIPMYITGLHFLASVFVTAKFMLVNIFNYFLYTLFALAFLIQGIYFILK